VSGKEARIPVKYHEIVSLLSIFKQRSEQCGAMGSVLTGQTIVNVIVDDDESIGNDKCFFYCNDTDSNK